LLLLSAIVFRVSGIDCAAVAVSAAAVSALLNDVVTTAARPYAKAEARKLGIPKEALAALCSAASTTRLVSFLATPPLRGSSVEAVWKHRDAKSGEPQRKRSYFSRRLRNLAREQAVASRRR